MQGHLGLQDKSITPDKVTAELAWISDQSDVEVTRYDYDAAHAFSNDENARAYDPEAAQLAWSRAVAFLRDTVR